MALTESITGQPSPIQKDLKHAYKAITDGALTALISGISGKRIRIWRLFITAAVKDKTCELLSGTDRFTLMEATDGNLVFEFKSSDGVPVFTCNDGDDFKADPENSENWYFYIVYSIE